MSNYIFVISRMIAVILVLINLTNPLNGSGFIRNTMLIVSLVIFYFISKLYQRKRKVVTPGYAIYFIVYFLIFTIGPYSYIYNQMSLDTIKRIPNASIPDDHYALYFTVFLILNTVIFSYLMTRKKLDIGNIEYKLTFNPLEAKLVLFTSVFILLPLSLIFGSTFELVLITACTYFIVSYLIFKNVRQKITYIIGLIFSLIIVVSHLTSRFIAVEYIMPTFLAITLIYILKNKSIKKIKIKYLMLSFILFFSVLLYGVVSEMYKLGRLNDVQNLTNVLFNYDTLIIWINRQLYRIIDIWSVLGGNIIEYTNTVGYYYGITYVKFFSSIFNFEYVSLPKISADLVGANYAQPGLLAEGYANFGVIGAVLNLLVVFIIAELFLERFYRNQTMFNLMLLSVPFTKVLIDGGTFNSIIFNVIFCIVTFTFAILLRMVERKHIKRV